MRAKTQISNDSYKKEEKEENHGKPCKNLN
jgi:hypothetical protein